MGPEHRNQTYTCGDTFSSTSFEAIRKAVLSDDIAGKAGEQQTKV
jgi:hypothetical protein